MVPYCVAHRQRQRATGPRVPKQTRSSSLNDPPRVDQVRTTPDSHQVGRLHRTAPTAGTVRVLVLIVSHGVPPRVVAARCSRQTDRDPFSSKSPDYARAGTVTTPRTAGDPRGFIDRSSYGD